MKQIISFLILLFFTLFVSTCNKKEIPQETEDFIDITVLREEASKKTAMADIGAIHVHMEYQQPNVGGREIFGQLVPYGEIWMIGANEPTTLRLPADMLFNGKQVPKGHYGLYAIPDSETWTFILNQNKTLPYSPKKEVARFKVPVTTLENLQENLLFTVVPNKDSENGKTEETGFIRFTWENTELTFPIEQMPATGSPRREAKNLNIEIEYGSPAVRGRQIWGTLVPYDKIWVTGAHTATNITFNQKVKIENTEIEAEKYAFFTIPKENGAWRLILSPWRDGGDGPNHLTDGYDETDIVLEWEIEPTWSMLHTERLTYKIRDTDNPNTKKIAMYWENLSISFEVEIVQTP